jgi:hypothetical protein
MFRMPAMNSTKLITYFMIYTTLYTIKSLPMNSFILHPLDALCKAGYQSQEAWNSACHNYPHITDIPCNITISVIPGLVGFFSYDHAESIEILGNKARCYAINQTWRSRFKWFSLLIGILIYIDKRKA